MIWLAHYKNQVSQSNVLSLFRTLYCCQAREQGQTDEEEDIEGWSIVVTESSTPQTLIWMWMATVSQTGTEQTDSSGMEPGRVGTYILHALDVGFNLLQHTGMPLRLLCVPHSLVDAFSHLLDVPLCIH